METEQINELIKHGTYQGMPIKGKLIETHISWIILTKKWAFKIKKPIRYPFLDFSSLEKRKFYCIRELSLNKRLTGIYLDVLPIRYQGHFFIGGTKGRIVDYAVRMKKLQASKKMDVMLENDKVQPSDIIRLAEKISAFHIHAKVIKTPYDLQQTKQKFNDILDISDWAIKVLEASHYSFIKEAVRLSDSFLEANHKLIELRIRKEYKRDVHGDLHAKNIFIYREPIIFDCIEFNDGYRQIDLLNEIAFFCMELDAFGRRDLSSLFLEKYLSLIPCMETSADQKLFVYFKFYRASVKAKVNALRAIQAEENPEHKEYREQVIKYLDLMVSYQQLIGGKY